MKVINCTPHAITIIPKEGIEITIPPSGILIRIATEEREKGIIETSYGSIPIVEIQFKGITFIKDGKEMTEEEIRREFETINGIIVPALLKDYKEEIQTKVGKEIRIFTPNTSKAVRNEQGRIIGVPSLIEV